MKLFNRKNKSANTDIDEFYASERRRRIGMAWVVTLGTLIVTLLLAAGFFYGGRWAYRAVFDNESTTQTAEDTNGTSTSPEGEDSNGLLDSIVIDEDTSDEPEITNDNEITGSDTNESSDDDELPNAGPSSLPATGPTEPEL